MRHRSQPQFLMDVQMGNGGLRVGVLVDEKSYMVHCDHSVSLRIICLRLKTTHGYLCRGLLYYLTNWSG